MSYETIYKCDNCKKVVNKDETVDIRIELDVGCKISSRAGDRRYISKDVCLSCAEKFGIVRGVTEDNEVKAELTTAEKLYDIVAEIVWENQQG